MGATVAINIKDPETDRRARELAAEEQTALARAARRRYGKGRHPAGLNYGACFSYALAVRRDEPLLFKGEDFAATDVRIALD